MVSLTVVLPAFNEARTIADSLGRLRTFLEAMGGRAAWFSPWEIVVVDDGSLDGTSKAAEAAAGGDPRIRVLALPVNQGKGAAVATGLRAARGASVVTTDVDLSYALEDIATVVDCLNRADGSQPPPDIVAGDRRHPASRLDLPLGALGHVARRQILSWAFNLCVRWFFGLPSRDTQCGLKGFRRPAALVIAGGLRTRRFLADIEIFLIARQSGLRIATVPVHLAFLSGDSTVRVAREFLSVARDAVRIRAAQARGSYRLSVCDEESGDAGRASSGR